MTHPATPAELAELVRPFVGTFRAIHRNDSSRIDIHHGYDSIDADVRAVTTEGVSVFSYDGCDMIPWAKVRGLTIADALGEVVYTREGLSDAELLHLVRGHKRFAREAA